MKFNSGDLVRLKNSHSSRLKVKEYKPNPITADRRFRPYVVVCRFSGEETIIEVFEEEIELVAKRIE